MFGCPPVTLAYVMAPFGAGLVAALLAAAVILWIVPFVVLAKVSAARGQSSMYILWGLLGIPGLIAGLLMMMAMPAPEAPPG